MILERNAMLVPGLSTKVLDRPHRILMFDLSSDEVWCIGLPPVRKTGRIAGYVPGPRVLKATDVLQALKNGHLKKEHFDAPGFWAMADADYLSEAGEETREQSRRRKRLEARDKAWEIIAPIVIENPLELLLRDSLRPQIQDRARATKKSLVTVYRLLHLYWAHGSTRNGLIPFTHRCGGSGQQRTVGVRRIGRAPRAFERGEMPTKGYILTEADKDRIATAFGLVGPTVSVRDAYNLLCASFFSDATTDSRGARKYELWPRHLRPSVEQFRYWGRKLSSSLHTAKNYGINVHRKMPTHRGGSSQDLAGAVGQYAMFDATSTDVYLVSMYDRQVKLPPMTRSLLIEVRSTACIGVYCGWESPSQATALQTVYCGATDKRELCKRFDIDLGVDEWPGMLCRTYLADNGEMRGAEISEAERIIRFGLEYARRYSGSSKGDVESRHHADHKGFDHKIPGSTLGKPRQRGVPHPAHAACWNYYEYMRALLLYIIKYNNKEVPSLAPTEMRIAGVRPTRINVLKWLRDHDQRADIVCDLNQLRALTLPKWKAVMQHNGIVLKTQDGQRNVAGLRYFSDALRADERFVHANTTRKVVPVPVRLQPESLSEIWLPSTRGLLKIPNVSSDELLKKQGTLADETQHMDSEAAYRDAHQQEMASAEVADTLERLQTTADAKRVAKDSPRQSKQDARANLRANAAAEQSALKKSAESSTLNSAEAPRASAQSPCAPAARATKPCSAMSAFLATLNEVEGG